MNGITPNGVSDNIPGRMWPDNGTVAAMQPGAFWAKITGNASGTNRYAWTQIDTGDTSAFDTGLSEEFAASGTSSADGAPAYEVNGRTDVATGTRVLLYPMGDLTYYGFAAPATSGGITVQDIDSSPSYTGITTLRFDQADGFTLSNPSAGVARVDFSGVTGSGTSGRVAYWNGTSSITSTSGFEFDGSNLLVPGDLTLYSAIIDYGTLKCGLVDATEADLLGTGGVVISPTVQIAADLTPGGAWLELLIGDSAGSSIHDPTECTQVRLVDFRSGSGASSAVMFYSQGASSTTSYVGFSTLIFGGKANVVADGAFGIITTAGSAPTFGLTGTLGPGAAATGGIITNIGSGSFVGTASNNAFTGTNSFSNTTTFTGSLLSQSAGTFTPASSSTVPLTVKGAASQTAYLQRNEDSTGALLGGFDDDGVYRGPADFGEWTSPPPPPPPPPPPVSPPIPPPP